MNERKKFAKVKEGEKCRGERKGAEKKLTRCLCFISHRMHTMREGANLSRCAKRECGCDTRVSSEEVAIRKFILTSMTM